MIHPVVLVALLRVVIIQKIRRGGKALMMVKLTEMDGRLG